MKQTLKNFVWIIAIVIVFSGLMRLMGRVSVTLDFGEDALTVAAGNEFDYTVSYNEVESLKLVEISEAGEIVSGDETRYSAWGERENDTWGSYTLCISQKVDTAILVTMQNDEKLIFNAEDRETTEAMLDFFVQLLENRV